MNIMQFQTNKNIIITIPYNLFTLVLYFVNCNQYGAKMYISTHS